MAQFSGNAATAVRNPIPESVLATVEHVPGVGTAAGQVEGYAQFVAPDGKAISNGLGRHPWDCLRPSPPDLGIAAHHGRTTDDLRRCRNGRRHGSEIPLQGGPKRPHPVRPAPKAYTITGIGQFGNASNLAGATLAAFTLPTAQFVVGEVGNLDSINVVAKPGADKAVVQRDIARALPRTAEVVTGQTVVNEQTSAVDQALSFFSTALARFCLHFSIRGRVHHFQHVLDNRWPAHAGAGLAAGRRAPSRRQVFRSVLAEAG